MAHYLNYSQQTSKNIYLGFHKMIKNYYLFNKLLMLLLVAAYFFCCCVDAEFKAPAPSPEDNACVLNLTSFPYQPQGECINKPKKINVNEWNSIPTYLCCQNALDVLGKAMALQAKIGNRIFIGKEQWQNCSGPFARQSTVSIQSCGFNDLYYGSSRCSSLSLYDMENDSVFRETSYICSQFGFNSFNSDCSKCTDAISKAKDKLLNKLNVVGNHREKAICTAAVVISIAAQRINDHSYIDDLYTCMSALDVYDPGYIKLKFTSVKAILALLIAITVLIMVITLIKHVIKNKKKDYKHVGAKNMSMCSGLYRFSKAEIENAMDFGNEKKCLGRGSAGTVYKGILPSGQVVAIKHIYKSGNLDTFAREVDGLSRVRHPNLVCLFGCCTEDGELYLVYEYCSNGNLAEHLLRKDSFLTWERRVKILRDCSLGLRYLHYYIDGCIVHRDIKLSDFGLAKMLGIEESKVFTDVRGTIGYMDPEYMSNAKLTCSSDIYSFGIVALQLLSGQKVIDLDLDARDQLTRKAKDVSIGKRALSEIKDPRLNENVNSVDYESVLQVAVLCVARSSKGRPTINVIVDEMDKAWKNATAGKRGKTDLSSSATSLSRSLDAIPV